ncbi:MAG: hypothetical protein JSW28_08255 [Thermoplasmata archaeon]|nr:MAG: hypothetical protein JSW28_08255 [Thermoplasmata archaeon]
MEEENIFGRRTDLVVRILGIITLVFGFYLCGVSILLIVKLLIPGKQDMDILRGYACLSFLFILLGLSLYNLYFINKNKK